MAEITLAATIDNIAVVTDFVSEQLDELGCSMKVQMQFSIAVDELFSNIAHYAYPSGEGMATGGPWSFFDDKNILDFESQLGYTDYNFLTKFKSKKEELIKLIKYYKEENQESDGDKDD